MGADAPLSCDAFLGGRLRLWQPKNGYRAGVDPVLLAASVPARPGQTVLDVGCGIGTAMFCLGARVPGLELTGLEIQPEYAALAERNAVENAVPAQVLVGDVTAMPTALRQRRFDHVITNPPYYIAHRATAPDNAGRGVALAETVPLGGWLEHACRRLAPRGILTVIQRADRLADVMAVMPSTLGAIIVQPLAPRDGRDAALVVIQAQKGAKAPMRLAAPIVMHRHARHRVGEKDYSNEIEAVLREGAALPISKG